jgi:hypothetical protein
VGMTAAGKAAAQEAAKQGVQTQFLPQQEAIKADAAIRQAGGIERAKASAAAQADLPRAAATADQTIAILDKALTHPGRGAATGMSSILDPRNYVPGTDARDFNVLLDQIKGKAFLEAFSSLKGGGQITEVEGKKATDAIARLNTAQSDEAFGEALRDLREVALAAKKRAQSAAGGSRGGYRVGQIIQQGGKRYRVTDVSDPNDPDVEEVR